VEVFPARRGVPGEEKKGTQEPLPEKEDGGGGRKGKTEGGGCLEKKDTTIREKKLIFSEGKKRGPVV